MNDDPPTEPLRGPAIYNPSRLLGKRELIDQFVDGGGLLESLADDLRRAVPGEPSQHHLLIGPHGTGKTTLLRRLRYAVEDDEELGAAWLPLEPPEEQYNVARLADLYVNWLGALRDALQARGRADEARRVGAAVAALPEADEERAAEALRTLAAEARRLGRRLLLLIDNVDLVLDRLKEQHWELRQALADNSWTTIVGAGVRPIDATYQYEQAFYDFFEIHDLRALDAAGTRRLLERLASLYGNGEAIRRLDDDPGRLPAIHAIAGGNPRTVALLYEALAVGGGDVETTLDRLFDRCTPLYATRIEALSPQAQRVLHALALHWHPATAAGLAAIVRLPVNAASAQLDRLVKQGLVEKVAYYEPESRTGFQIAERPFNLWQLMRAGGGARQRLTWFAEFLRLFHGAEHRRRPAAPKDRGPSSSGRRGPLAQAAVLVQRGNWEGAVSHARSFLSVAVEAFEDRAWDETLAFFREAVVARRVSEAVDLLDELGLGERWLPLREALAAARAGTPKYLRRVAPEVRRPAEEILSLLQSNSARADAPAQALPGRNMAVAAPFI